MLTGVNKYLIPKENLKIGLRHENLELYHTTLKYLCDIVKPIIISSI